MIPVCATVWVSWAPWWNAVQSIPSDLWTPLWLLTELKDLRLVANHLKKLPLKFTLFTNLTSLVGYPLVQTHDPPPHRTPEPR